MSDAQWYYAENGEQQGPVSLAEMLRLVSAKRIQPTDLVWCDGMADWLPVGEVAALSAVKQKPKPVRKAAPPESKGEEPKAPNPKPAAAEPKAATAERSTPKPEAPPVQEVVAEDSFPSLGSVEAEDEPDDDEIDELAEELFCRPKFPAKRPHNFERESRREIEREPEIIRETTREVVVMERADAQLSSVMLVLQLLCWALCFIAVLAAAIIYGVHWLSAGSDSSTTLFLGVAVGSYVLGHSAQRCFEILAALKNK